MVRVMTVVAGGVLAAIAITGCGGGGASPAASPSTTASSTPPTLPASLSTAQQGFLKDVMARDGQVDQADAGLVLQIADSVCPALDRNEPVRMVYNAAVSRIESPDNTSELTPADAQTILLSAARTLCPGHQGEVAAFVQQANS